MFSKEASDDVFVKYNAYCMFLFSISLHALSPMQYLHNSNRIEYTRNIVLREFSLRNWLTR